MYYNKKIEKIQIFDIILNIEVKKMDDIIVAQKIVEGTFNNYNSNFFSTYSPIYKKTNESISNYKEYLKNKKTVLSVIASGNQLFNMIYYDTKNIDAFDISKFSKYFLNLQIAAIKSLDRNNFFKFFYNSINNDTYYDDIYYECIREKLDKNNKEFWDSLFDFYDWIDIYNSNIFSNEAFSITHLKNENEYLKNDINYNILKEKIGNININIYDGDIFNLNNLFNKEYDLVYLSNILDYNDPLKMNILINSLKYNKDGLALLYYFTYNKKYNEIKKNDNYVNKEFSNKNGILVYKKKS